MWVLEISSFIFHFAVLFLMQRLLFQLYNHTSRNSDGNSWYQTYFPWKYQSFSNLIEACFFEAIKVVHALLWGLKFSRNWRKKWAPTNTTVGAYFWTLAQPFPIFMKLLAIICSIQNLSHLRNLNLKINTNTKSLMLIAKQL